MAHLAGLVGTVALVRGPCRVGHQTAVANTVTPDAYPAPGTTPGMLQFRLAKGALVVIGPSALALQYPP